MQKKAVPPFKEEEASKNNSGQNQPWLAKWTQTPTNANLSAAPGSQLALEAAPGQSQHMYDSVLDQLVKVWHLQKEGWMMFQAAQLCFTYLISMNNICKRRLFRLSRKRRQAKTTLVRISPGLQSTWTLKAEGFQKVFSCVSKKQNTMWF